MDARAVLDDSISEAELQAEVIKTAHQFGWLCAHFRPAKTDKGWRTPVEADGKGFFDLVMMHEHRGECLFVECKAQRGKLSEKQQAWRAAARSVGEMSGRNVWYFTWRPADWSSGLIERVLRGES